METRISIIRYNVVKYVSDEVVAEATKCALSFIQQEIKVYNQQISLGYNPLTSKQISLLKKGMQVQEKKKLWFITYYKKKTIEQDTYIVDYIDCPLLLNHLVGATQDNFRPQNVPLITAQIVQGFQNLQKELC